MEYAPFLLFYGGDGEENKYEVKKGDTFEIAQ